MRDEYFLIRGEYHEFYHPDGIRAIAYATFGSYAISKVPPPARIRGIRGIRVL